MGLDSVSLLDLGGRAGRSRKARCPSLPLGKSICRKRASPATCTPPHAAMAATSSTREQARSHCVHEQIRRAPSPARVELTECPEDRSLSPRPFDKPGHFYYNQKIVGFRASGYVNYNGKTYTFEPSDSFAVLDWGRGVWTYENTWYWSGGGVCVAERDAVRLESRLRLRRYERGERKHALHAGTAHKLGGIN